MALGLFDRPSMASTMIKFPELYKICQDKTDFNIKVSFFIFFLIQIFVNFVIRYFGLGY